MKLTIADRLSIQNILPEKDNYVNLCIKREIIKKTTFSSDEIEKNSIVNRQDGDKMVMTWKEVTTPTEVEFKASEITYVMEILKKLSEEKGLTSAMLSIYELFSEL